MRRAFAPEGIVDSRDQVAAHYGKGGLEGKITKALEIAGLDRNRLTVADLAPVDEFHVGGMEATKELAAHMELQPGLRLLDVGSGIGGPARYFAAEHGCLVTGVDLTEEFTQVARSLTRLLKLEAAVEFRHASGLQMPFAHSSFSRASLIHVGMNIPDKDALFAEVRRVLMPGALFAIFDLVRTAPGALSFPLPWATGEDTSFVRTALDYRDALTRAGFSFQGQRSRLGFSIEFTERIIARMSLAAPPPLGLHLVMGGEAPVMIKNVLTLMKQGTLEPLEMFARAV
jgi:SAM-dependent methyltransferase